MGGAGRQQAAGGILAAGPACEAVSWLHVSSSACAICLCYWRRAPTTPPLLSSLESVLTHVQAQPGDLLLIAAGPAGAVNRALDRVLQFLGKDLGLIKVG